MVVAADKARERGISESTPVQGRLMSQTTVECPVDLEDGLARAGDDREFFLELLQMFIDDAPARLKELQAAIEASDAIRVCSIAHGIKGAAANLSANAVRDSAYELETLGRQAATSGYDAPLTQLRTELQRLADFVQRF